MNEIDFPSDKNWPQQYSRHELVKMRLLIAKIISTNIFIAWQNVKPCYEGLKTKAFELIQIWRRFFFYSSDPDVEHFTLLEKNIVSM